MQNLFAKLSFFSTLLIAGLLIYSCKEDNPVEDNPFPATKVTSILVDDFGVVWAGTDAGLLSFWDGKWTSYTENDTVLKGLVNDLAYKHSGSVSELLLASFNGAGVAANNINTIVSVKHFLKESSGLIDNQVQSAAGDNQNAYWYATPQGISIVRNNKWYQESKWGDLVTNPVLSLAAKSDNWIIAGTAGLGVARMKYDPGVDGITGASYYNVEWAGIDEKGTNPKATLPSDTILSVYVDKSDNQWFGTPQGVAFHTGSNTRKGFLYYTTGDGLINNQVLSITGDNKGITWFGTVKGVSSFDGSHWKSYTVADGLINPKVNDIAVDSKGMVWFATDGGISTFDGISWKSYYKK